VRLPPVFRTTPFRLTLLFLALFAGAAASFLVYVYVATAGETIRRTDRDIDREIASLEMAHRLGGVDAVNQSIIERTADGSFEYLLQTFEGQRITGTLAESPAEGGAERVSFQIEVTQPNGDIVEHAGRGREIQLTSGHRLFVGEDIGESQRYIVDLVRASWGAGAFVLLLGLFGGVLFSRNVSRHMSGLTRTVAAVQAGDLQARVPLRGVNDEYDELAAGLNAMLDRVERLMGGLRHAGDAIAHDLRSPLTRLRTKLEVALIDVEAGRVDPRDALETTLDDADGLLKTFNAVLAISRLQAAGEAPDQALFDPAGLASDFAELYQPLCEDKGLEFSAEIADGLSVRGNRAFIAQALANLLDNAAKYTPDGGAIRLRLRRRSSGEVEFSVTDTGPGVPEADRTRIVDRFVRLENSRSQPGAGLGLSLVSAVAEAHGGRLEIDEGPGQVGETGPGLRTALVFPRPPDLVVERV
jgi:signal transduction histidine kinase